MGSRVLLITLLQPLRVLSSDAANHINIHKKRVWLKKEYLWGTITHRRHAGDVVNGKAGATPCLECNSRVTAAGAESVGPTASSLCVCKGHDVVVFVFFKKVGQP